MFDLQPASFEEFEREARQGNVIPVVRTMLADLQTPVGAFLRVAGKSPYAFLLESIEGGERIARYSFLGANPEMIVRGSSSQTFVERGDKKEVYPGVATDWIRDYFRERKLARRPGLVPFAGGAVGYLGYNAARWFDTAIGASETLPASAPIDAVWMFCRTMVAFDRVRQRMEIVSIVLTEEAEGSHDRLRELYDEAVNRTRNLEGAILHGETASTGTNPTTDEVKTKPPKSNTTRRDFEEGVRRIKEYIAAGDCYP